MSEEDNEIITEEIRRKILNLAQTFSAVVKVKGANSNVCAHMTCTYIVCVHAHAYGKYVHSTITK